jgi:capsular polysaccharide biosynthesis protein
MKIAIRDSLRHLALAMKLIRHRLVVRARFIQPSSLAGECVHASAVAPDKIRLPPEFRARSRSYRSHPMAEFAREDACICSFGHDLSVHEARFVRVRADTFIDVDHQARELLPILGKPFTEKPTEERKTLVMPWGGGGASYGDFIIKLLPKLARLLDALPEDECGDACVCLPHFHQYEWAVDYLSLMGIKRIRILDGANTVMIPAGGKLVLGTGPQLGHGISHPHDIIAMIRRLRQNAPVPLDPPWRKIYISRKMGRKMLNEADLIIGLEKRGFEIVHLEELSLSRQIKLFQEAAVITGPHGAGHANIIWSLPGTQLLEVFHPSWMHPCYALLSEILGLGYHCLVGHDGEAQGSWTEKSRYGIFEDPSIDSEVFFRKLDTITKQ